MGNGAFSGGEYRALGGCFAGGVNKRVNIKIHGYFRGFLLVADSDFDRDDE